MEPTVPKAGLHLITGRAGAGKTRLLIEQLGLHMARGERAVLLVPEQRTFEAERRVAERFSGSLGVQVLSLERLAERLLDGAGDRRTYLSAAGVQMVVRRAACRRAEALYAFAHTARSAGFAAQIAALIGACKQSCITPEMLQKAADALPARTPLSDKLHDTALLYEDTETYLKDRYLTEDDRILAAVSLIPNSFLAGVPVYIDELAAVNEQVMLFLQAILPAAASVTVALTLEEAADDADVFAVNASACRMLSELAARLGLPVYTRALGGRRIAAPALMHLERRLFAYPDRPYPAEAPAITVFGANSRTSEVRALCRKVLLAARAGVRYRDMAVLVSDMEAYGTLLQSALSARGIPFFLDARRSVKGHAAAALLLSAVRAVSGGFAPTEVLGVAKTGLSGVEAADAELFENYVLRFGVRYGRMLTPFSRGEAFEVPERVRLTLLTPLLSLREGLAKPTAGEKARACYAYLHTLSLRQQLTERAAALTAQGRVTEAEEVAQVWNALVALLEQIDAIMGSERMSRAEFLTVLEEGLSEASLGVLPDTADALRLSPLSRGQGGRVRALFLLGCSEGLLPRDHGDDGLINEPEQETLEALGLPKLHGAAYLTAHEQLVLYEALARAGESLTLFYPFTGESGELAPSSLVLRVQTVFPHCTVENDLTGGEALPLSRADARRQLSDGLRTRAEDGVAAPLLSALQMHFASSEPELTARMGDPQRASGTVLPKTLAAELYGGKLAMSASRLEQFNACPFRHFVTYGLHAEERPEFRERAADLGAFYHDALNALFRRALELGLSVRELTEAQQQLLLDEVLPAVIAAHNDGVLLGSERLHAVLFLMVETLKKSVTAIVRQLRAGAFEPMGTEVRFGDGGAFPAIELTAANGRTAKLHGVIDRIDRAGNTVRIIDYKTGGRALDFAAIADGLTLQLPLYLAAAVQSGREGGGMYYMPVRVPPVKEGEDESAVLTEAFRLRGLTLKEPRVIEVTDAALNDAGRSTVVHALARRRDGSLAGPLADAAEFDALLKAAKSRAESSLSEMLAGAAAASPVEGACKYCPHRAVCRFDSRLPACRTKPKRRLDQAAYFESILGGAHGDMD